MHRLLSAQSFQMNMVQNLMLLVHIMGSQFPPIYKDITVVVILKKSMSRFSRKYPFRSIAQKIGLLIIMYYIVVVVSMTSAMNTGPIWLKFTNTVPVF